MVWGSNCALPSFFIKLAISWFGQLQPHSIKFVHSISIGPFFRGDQCNILCDLHFNLN
jgi:hypothetical protein